jgi:hypothetical protein
MPCCKAANLCHHAEDVQLQMLHVQCLADLTWNDEGHLHLFQPP